jgi:hypothetical protein
MGCLGLAFPEVVTPDILGGMKPAYMIQFGLTAIFFKS